MARRRSKKGVRRAQSSYRAKPMQRQKSRRLANEYPLLHVFTLGKISPFYQKRLKPKELHPQVRMDRHRKTRPNERLNREINKYRRVTYAKIFGSRDRNVIYSQKVCKSRSTRRQVLHALKKTGKGSGARQKRKYTEKSKVRC